MDGAYKSAVNAIASINASNGGASTSSASVVGARRQSAEDRVTYDDGGEHTMPIDAALRRAAAIGQHIEPSTLLSPSSAQVMQPVKTEAEHPDVASKGASEITTYEYPISTDAPTMPSTSASAKSGTLPARANALDLKGNALVHGPIPPPLRSPSYGHFTPPLSIQELFYPQSRCFGCGPANRFGLRIRSMPPLQPGGPVTAYIAACPVYHSNGMGMTNGGVLASLIDCHTGAAIAWRGWEKKMSGIGIGVACGDCKDGSHGCLNGPFLTSSLELKYRRPTPYNLDAVIVAEVVHMTEVAAVVKCRVISGGEVTVVGEAKWRRPTKKQWGRTKEKLAAIQQNVHEHEAQMRNY